MSINKHLCRKFFFYKIKDFKFNDDFLRIFQFKKLSFGIGPRVCIGMRFALVEIKLTLAQILRKLTIVPSPGTMKKLTFSEGLGIRRSKDPIHAMFKRRESNSNYG
jgi:hypothetical protein